MLYQGSEGKDNLKIELSEHKKTKLRILSCTKLSTIVTVTVAMDICNNNKLYGKKFQIEDFCYFSA